MSLVELMKKREAVWKDIHKGDRTAYGRLVDVNEEIVRVVDRSSTHRGLFVVSHGAKTVVVDLQEKSVRDATDRSAACIDRWHDPYGKTDDAVPTTEVAIAEFAL